MRSAPKRFQLALWDGKMFRLYSSCLCFLSLTMGDIGLGGHVSLLSVSLSPSVSLRKVR